MVFKIKSFEKSAQNLTVNTLFVNKHFDISFKAYSIHLLRPKKLILSELEQSFNIEPDSIELQSEHEMKSKYLYEIINMIKEKLKTQTRTKPNSNF